MIELIEAGLDYIQMGLRVIALSGKTPNTDVHRTWSYDLAFHDGDQANWVEAAQHPDTTGVGILTGPVYYVVDIDGEEGAAAWRDLAGEQHMPDRWVARTGRGLHLWYASYEEWPTTKLAEKLDFKGFGGYVAAPPSLHPNGHRYEWLLAPGEEPPVEMPEPLLEHLRAARFAKVRSREDRLVKQAGRLAVGGGEIVNSAASFTGIIERMKSASPGERNNVLNWAAFAMASDGAGDDDLQLLAASALEVGMGAREVTRTINSALDALND